MMLDTQSFVLTLQAKIGGRINKSFVIRDLNIGWNTTIIRDSSKVGTQRGNG